MADNIKGIPFSSKDEGLDIPTIAKAIVQEEINDSLDDNVSMSDLYVVWFCYILGGWKALVSSNRPNGTYYEVTHTGDENKTTYVDTYVKTSNTKYTV